MELPFKKGDIVSFKNQDKMKWWFDEQNINNKVSYKVLMCKNKATCATGVSVILDDNDKREWDSSWFELDKNSIVRSILEDL